MRASIVLLAVALALVLVSQWWSWPPPVPGPNAAGPAPAPSEVPSRSAENPVDLFTPLREKEEYVSITERPLFLPDRRPPSEEPEEEGPPENDLPSDLANLDLNAVLITPSESSAWIRDPAKKELVRLRLGDDLSGWAVQEIRADRILLERQGEKDTLVLRDYKNMPPPAPPRRKPAVRKPPTRPHQSPAKPPQPARNRQRVERSQRNDR